ncbi:nuclear transport factor 2 family protein [Streptacidiphilus sp. N1-12]|uniref:Nuclear transport factor 2 family protein n=2 Tax=Streptacidiphilus alkalitolerans TaxID=3342712 RepID=A0ABV6V3F6_9ACTN
MFWIPEFADAVLASHGGAASNDATTEFLQALRKGALPDPAADWPIDLVVDEPEHGRTTDRAAVVELLSSSAAWLRKTNAEVELIDSFSVGDRGVVEAEIVIDHPERGGERTLLPVVALAESHGGSATVRLYYSHWPLSGVNRLRPAILPAGAALPDDSVAVYFRSLAAGDAAGLVTAFAPGGTFREPSGGLFLHHGTEEIGPFFEGFFGYVGGIGLDICAVTDDGTHCAVEYICTNWGANRLVPQAGLGVYQRGPDGRLTAVRLYDDVVGP